MNWSFRLARIAGIDIKIHFTFFLVFILGALPWSGYGLSGALFGIALILLLFVCVTLHELGHAFAARIYKLPVRQIILLPIGGLALLEKSPEKPLHELVIALAGPLVNVVIAGVLIAITNAGIALGGLDSNVLMSGVQAPSWELLVSWLLQANIALVIFNMIPAFPLDGGRVLRALLAMGFGPRRGTNIAVVIGQAIAIGLGVFGVLTGNFTLALVAVFIFFGASQERESGVARNVLTTRRVGDAYNKHALTLEVGDRMSKAVDYILTSYQPDFAVLQGSRLLGIVTRDDVLRKLAEGPADTFVTLVMQREVLVVQYDATLEETRTALQERGARVAAVYEGERYLGLISNEDIAEAFAVLAYQERGREVRTA